MTLRTLTLIAAAVTMLAAPAFALDLQTARTQGLVGETLTGYVAVVKSTPEAEALAAEINAKRRAEYARIAAANGQSADVVGKLASEQIINGLPSGSYYKDAGGAWKKR